MCILIGDNILPACTCSLFIKLLFLHTLCIYYTAVASQAFHLASLYVCLGWLCIADNAEAFSPGVAMLWHNSGFSSQNAKKKYILFWCCSNAAAYTDHYIHLNKSPHWCSSLVRQSRSASLQKSIAAPVVSRLASASSGLRQLLRVRRRRVSAVRAWSSDNRRTVTSRSALFLVFVWSTHVVHTSILYILSGPARATSRKGIRRDH